MLEGKNTTQIHALRFEQNGFCAFKHIHTHTLIHTYTHTHTSIYIVK